MIIGIYSINKNNEKNVDTILYRIWKVKVKKYDINEMMTGLQIKISIDLKITIANRCIGLKKKLYI